MKFSSVVRKSDRELRLNRKESCFMPDIVYAEKWLERAQKE